MGASSLEMFFFFLIQKPGMAVVYLLSDSILLCVSLGSVTIKNEVDFSNES